MLKVPLQAFSIATYLLRCLGGSKGEYVSSSYLQMTLDEHSFLKEVIALSSHCLKGGQHLIREYHEHKFDEKQSSNDW